jgi:hypothetical protein
MASNKRVKSNAGDDDDGRIDIGNSSVRVDYLGALQQAWRERRLVFFLGAGVSNPYGLSNWTDLVLDLVLKKSHKLEQFWPHYRKALALWMTDYFDFSPLALARVVKYNLSKSGRNLTEDERLQRFLQLVRKSLYSTFNEEPDGGNTTLQMIAKLCARGHKKREARHIPMIFTTNFDNVLELELKKAKVKAQPIYDATRRTNNDALPVIHVHGYLPHAGKIPSVKLVFTEDEYHHLSYSFYHWALADIINCLRNYTVLFVGHSMSDPNLRRLLDATHLEGEGLTHYLLRKEYELKPAERARAERIVQEYAEEQGRRANLTQVKVKSDVSAALDGMLRQAHVYDRQLFKDMGIGTIWLNDFDDIPKILEQVAVDE